MWTLTKRVIEIVWNAGSAIAGENTQGDALAALAASQEVASVDTGPCQPMSARPAAELSRLLDGTADAHQAAMSPNTIGANLFGPQSSLLPSDAPAASAVASAPAASAVASAPAASAVASAPAAGNNTPAIVTGSIIIGTALLGTIATIGRKFLGRNKKVEDSAASEQAQAVGPKDEGEAVGPSQDQEQADLELAQRLQTQEEQAAHERDAQEEADRRLAQEFADSQEPAAADDVVPAAQPAPINAADEQALKGKGEAQEPASEPAARKEVKKPITPAADAAANAAAKTAVAQASPAPTSPSPAENGGHGVATNQKDLDAKKERRRRQGR